MRPERIVHIGLGAFFRAHQAWFTEHSVDRDSWGIVSYTGRSSEQADLLNAQGCKYSLITRGRDSDEIEVISSVVRAEAGTNLADLEKTISNPNISLVTLTITEAGYEPQSDKFEDFALGRLALALEERRKSCNLPIALVPCDNLPSNGLVLRNALTKIGQPIGAEFSNYLSTLSFVTTSIDRITPKTTESDIEYVNEIGTFQDRSPVITEPFKDWVLQGHFPLGRPKWETAGARFVEDIEPFENRKLWLLNGAHSLMAYMGIALNLETVDQAIAHPEIRKTVDKFWDEACNHLDSELLKLTEYRHALIERFANPRIGYKLLQIAQDGLNKISVRIVPVALHEIAAGRNPEGAFAAILHWYRFVKTNPEFIDSRKPEILAALSLSDAELTLGKLLPKLPLDQQSFLTAIRAL